MTSLIRGIFIISSINTKLTNTKIFNSLMSFLNSGYRDIELCICDVSVSELLCWTAGVERLTGPRHDSPSVEDAEYPLWQHSLQLYRLGLNIRYPIKHRKNRYVLGPNLLL